MKLFVAIVSIVVTLISTAQGKQQIEREEATAIAVEHSELWRELAPSSLTPPSSSGDVTTTSRLGRNSPRNRHRRPRPPSYFASKSSSGIATSDAVMAPGGKGKKSSASKGSKAPSKGKGKKSSSSSSSKGGKGTGDPTEPTPNNPPPTSKSPGKGGGKGESSPAPSVDINPKEPPTMGPDVPTMSPAPSGLITLPPICPDERECGRNPRPI